MSSNQNIKFVAKDISKSFFRKNFIFSSVGIELENGESLAITGRNGSGKSTLMKIFANLMLPSSGETEYWIGGSKTPANKVPGKIAFAAPYANLYEEFSPLELAEIYCGLSGNNLNKTKFDELAENFELEAHLKKTIKNFSSGMKQRVKLILAFLTEPDFLFLDEPGTNLDKFGISKAVELAKAREKSGLITFIASNDPIETAHCKKTIEV